VLRALHHLATAGRSCEVVAVCDSDPSTRDHISSSLQFFDHAEQALRQSAPDVVCVCVNESAHHTILTKIPDLAPTARLIICEKPLTQTLDEFADVEDRLSGIPITVNFVERHSPIVRDFRIWLERTRVRVHRVDFQWGKYRYRDKRPTMGVLSEISHPLDLVRYLIDIPADATFSIVRASLLRSNFTCMPSAFPDTASVTYLLNSVVVTGSSSFLWPSRQRQITALMSSDGGAETFQAVMNFDDKRWDEDRMSIYSLDPRTGARELVNRTAYSNDDFPEELYEINKVAQFLDESIALLESTHSNTVALLADARWAQLALHSLEDSAASAPALWFTPNPTARRSVLI
jgi:predicted dehydrogenase